MKYEIKKLFSSLVTYVCLSIVLLFLAFFVVRALEAKDLSKDAYDHLLSDINTSKMTDNEICDQLYKNCEQLQNKISELGDIAFQQPGEYGQNLIEDHILYKRAYLLADYIYKRFPLNRSKIVENSLYNISEEKEKTSFDSSIIKNNELVVKKYNKIINLEFKNPGNIESLQMFFDNTIWDYAMIAFVIMITVRMFTMDISCGAYKIIQSSLNGRQNLFIKQFLAVSSVITIITFINAVLQLICGIFLFGVNDLSIPLQMYQEFEFCPFSLSIGNYLIIKFICKLLFYIMLAAITSAVTVILCKQLSSFAVSLIIGILPLIVVTYFFVCTTNGSGSLSENNIIYNNMRCLVPQSLLNIKSYFNAFDYINVFGIQICRLICNIFIAILTALTCFLIALKNYGKPKGVAI